MMMKIHLLVTSTTTITTITTGNIKNEISAFSNSRTNMNSNERKHNSFSSTTFPIHSANNQSTITLSKTPFLTFINKKARIEKK